MQIILQDSPLFIAEADAFSAPSQVRFFNGPSQKKQQVAYEALANYAKREGEKEPITLKGKLEGKVLDVYAIAVDNVTYSLLEDNGWWSQLQSALKSL